MAGKGDAYRPVDAARYRAGWERTFGSATGKFVARLERDFGPRTGPRPPKADRYTGVYHHIQFRDAQPVRLPGDRHG